jgi:dephospho-CoA kinase
VAPDSLTPRTPALRIGLTGGIGSGKSTVAALLAASGGAIVDSDAIARRLTLPGGAAIEPIRAAFGAAYIDPQGALDRTRMRELAFSDADAKRQLETVLHPLIGHETEAQARASTSAVIVFDVPLLVESGRWRARVDKVLVIDCLETTQLQRVSARSGWSPEAARAVIASQTSRASRRAAADAVIFNDGITLDHLGEHVNRLWHWWAPSNP